MNLEERLLENFTEYATYVNNERAIVNAYDGLKPVMRRILFTMYGMKLKPGAGSKKSASVVGRTMDLHPHGDSGIYNALVRAAQPFSLLHPIVRGVGNMGSLDMGPAAMRYTEASFNPFGYSLVEGLSKNIIPMVDSYDGSMQEPAYLPVPFPYLLVNGTSGIGVGMAASIPSHNLTDVLNMISYFVQNPDATSGDLVDKLVGPDFSSGCDIVNKEDFKNSYTKGSGGFRMRAKFSITGSRIKATNLPYKASGAKVMTQLTEAQERGECTFIREVIDMSSKDEVLLIDVSTKDMDMAIRELCRVSDLEKTFSLDFSVVMDSPVRVNLRDYVSAWTTIHKQLNKKDLEQQREKVAARRHIIDGLLKAIMDMDEVIKIIRGSENRGAAKDGLIEKGFSELQANAILDMRLAKLTKLSGVELEQERQEAIAEINRLDVLLNDEQAFNNMLVEQFSKFYPMASKRQSTISNNVFPKKVKEDVTEFSVVVKKDKALITEGYSRSTDAYNGDKTDPVYVLSGNSVVPVKDTKDPVIVNVWGVLHDKIEYAYHISEDGYIKKTARDTMKTSRKAIVAKQDKVVQVLLSDKQEESLYVLLTLNDGSKCQFLVDDINATGRNARGVGAVKLENSRKVVSAEWTEKISNVQVGRNKKIK